MCTNTLGQRGIYAYGESVAVMALGEVGTEPFIKRRHDVKKKVMNTFEIAIRLTVLNS